MDSSQFEWVDFKHDECRAKKSFSVFVKTPNFKIANKTIKKAAKIMLMFLFQ